MTLLPGSKVEHSHNSDAGLATTASAPVAQSASRLGLLSLVCVMYLVVSGGAYGLEDAVSLAGPRLTILLCLLVPITLSLPTALMAAELTALMPVEGGFYFWVKSALGPFAGFVEAYLTILYTAVDTTIYPVLFVTYLSFVIPLGVAGQMIVAVAIIWLCGLLNIMGVRPVGDTSVALTAILIAPFLALVVVGFPRLIHWQPPMGPIIGGNFLAGLGAGLSVVIWNFGGWENLSVVAAEIEAPRRNYLRAVAVALPLVVLGYLLPLGVSLSGAKATAQWHVGWFAQEGYLLGGPALGIALAVGGAVSAFAVFEAAMLWVSRIPFVLAREHYFPHGLTQIWSANATPGRSIIVCCAIFSVLLPLGFVSLVVLDVFFYMGALVLEMAALIRLRRYYPRRDGLFMIRGGRPALIATAAGPIVTWFATFGLVVAHGDDKADFAIAIALAASAWPAYALLRWRYGGPSGPP